jgi:hypothetical protein
MTRSRLVICLLFISFSILNAQEKLIFSVMGDVPRSAKEDVLLQKQIKFHNLHSSSQFMLHVGDIKAGKQPCDEQVYSKVSGYLKKLTVPTFLVPGDNEWNDCENPEQAWAYWTQYFLQFDKNWNHNFSVIQQKQKPENVAFVTNNVLMIGINLVGEKVHDQKEWDSMMKDDIQWIKSQFDANKTKVYAAVIFTQANLNDKHNKFSKRFFPLCNKFKKPVLFLHGDGHRWLHDTEWKEKNITRVQVDQGGIALPLQVEVSKEYNEVFRFNRTPFEMD